MDRDSRLRSWFNRAVQLSPIFRNAETMDDQDDDDLDRPDTARADEPKHKDSGIPYKKYLTWCQLREDNVRFWDCFGMIRSDPTLSCQSAILNISETPNSEYFPRELRTGLSYYFNHESELDVELIRLNVENPRLHAVLWVLADNPNLQVDAVLGAIFRMSEGQFQEKFHFEYEAGCFSSKKTILRWCTRGFCDKQQRAGHFCSKRSRSSTPLRCARSWRHCFDSYGHSLTRKTFVPRGQNISGNRKTSTHTREPSRKRPYNMLMAVLLNNNNRHNMCHEIPKTSHMKMSFDDFDDEEDGVDGHNRTRNNNQNMLSFEQSIVGDPTTNRETSKPVTDLDNEEVDNADQYSRARNNNNNQNITSEDLSAFSVSDDSVIDLRYNELENSSLYTDCIFPIESINSMINNKALMNVSKYDKKKHFRDRILNKSNNVCPLPVKPLHTLMKSKYHNYSSCDSHTYSPQQTGLEYDTSYSTTIQSCSTVDNNDDTTSPRISFSDKPMQSETSFIPYPISWYPTPKDLIARHARIADKTFNVERKCDIHYCFNFHEKSCAPREIVSKGQSSTRQPEKIRSPVTHQMDSKADEDCSGYPKDERPSNNKNPEGILPEIMLKDCKTSQPCKQLKESLVKLGRKQFTKPLLQMINRSILCSET